MIEFFVPAAPVAQPRQRHRVTRIGGRTVAQNYTPESHPVNEFKRAVRFWAKREIKSPLVGPIAVDLLLIFPRPKSRRRKFNKTEPYCQKPDWDNLSKSICDALNGVAWKDDAQITSARICKRLAGDNVAPGVRITITEDSA